MHQFVRFADLLIIHLNLRRSPLLQCFLAKKIVEFLDYMPFKSATASLADRLYHVRIISGLTQKQVAANVKCDESNLRLIELGKRTPGKRMLQKILHFIAAPV